MSRVATDAGGRRAAPPPRRPYRDLVLVEPWAAATRDAYDRVALDYAEVLRDALAAQPFDRAVLGAFAELVATRGGGEVVDVGCGPGTITAYLRSIGMSVSGIDLSPQMVDVARRDHPGLRFQVGSMSALDLADASVAGVVAWYSIIHTPPEALTEQLAELTRVLVPGGHLLLAFQVGEDELLRLTHAYGHHIELDAYRLSPDHVTERLALAGLDVIVRLVREAQDSEKTRQAFLVACRQR